MNRRRPDTKKRASNTSDGRQKSDDLAYGIHAVQELLNKGGQQIRQVLWILALGPGLPSWPNKPKIWADCGSFHQGLWDLAKGRPFQELPRNWRLLSTSTLTS